MEKKEQLLRVLQHANSLHDLFDVLRRGSAAQHGHGKDRGGFRFLFFSVVVKMDALFSLLILRCDFLDQTSPIFTDIRREISSVRQEVNQASEDIQHGRTGQGQARIAAAAERYERIWERLNAKTRDAIKERER